MTAGIREVHIYRADGVVGNTVEPVVIRIEHEAPAGSYGDPDYARTQAARFASEGAALAEALWSSCPGGTVDALIAALLARRASLLRVTFPQAVAR